MDKEGWSMNIIRQKKSEIMAQWRQVVLERIPTASSQSRLALYNSLPDFLENLAKLLDANDEQEKIAAEIKEDLIGKVHGQHRANNSYAIDQMIEEYFILKDVVILFLNKANVLTPELRENIGDSFQKALQVSVAQFSKSLLDSQENFVLAMAHDFRSPLMAIKMQSELMIRRKSYNEETCRKISQYVDKVDQMIQQLLDRMKSQNHGQNFSDYAEFDLYEMIMGVTNVYEELYPDVLVVNGKQTIVKWNRNSIERVIDNLVSNAFKYGDKTKPITITVKSDEVNVFFSIHNFGPPIPLTEQATLFEKFKRTENSRNQKGWGIGLSYVKSQIEAHKGIILVNSDSRGTTFKFEMPKNIGESQKLSLEAAQMEIKSSGKDISNDVVI